MIKERYVNIEVAKLLRDKGFDEDCIGYYVNDEPNDVKYSFLRETNSTWEARCCSAPTQSMACDWIEETFNISIEVLVGIIGYRIEILYALKDPNIASSIIIHDFDDNTLCGDNSDGSWSSKETAYNEAIKFVLTNLI